MNWTAELLNKVEDFCHNGYTNAQIASKLKDDGLFVTKNAVKHVCTEHHFNRGNRSNGDHGNNNDNNQQESVEQDIDYNDDQTIRNARITYRYMSFRDKKKKSPKQILKYAGYDPDKWILVSAHPNEWTVTSADEAPKWNFQFKISIKPKTNNDLSVEDIAKLLNDKIEPIEFPTVKTDSTKNLIIPIADSHFGFVSFDTMLPHLQRIFKVVDQGFDNISIEILGDVVHSDFIDKTMTYKTTQLEHVDNLQGIKDAKKFYHLLIEHCLLHTNNLQTYFVKGNHDPSISYLLVDGLHDLYPQAHVHINNDIMSAYQLGKSNVGIMIMHGDKATKNMPMEFVQNFMPVMQKTSWYEVHYGHKHTKDVIAPAVDKDGITCREMATIKPQDDYEKMIGALSKKYMTLYEYDTNELIKTYQV
ncbi:MAG: hypothetical protein ABF619_06715 [Oenococcus oeni]